MNTRQIKKAEGLGYSVEIASEKTEDTPEVYRVEGHGIDLQITTEEELHRIINPDAHQNRRDAERINDPEDNFKQTPEEALRSSLKAQVSLGDITKAEADEILREWKDTRTPSP